MLFRSVGIENTRASAKWRPNGRIIVWDDLLGEFVPVEGVKVVAHCGLKTAKGITDENGYFSVSKTFNRAVKYSIVWEDEYWDIRQGKTKQARYHNGNKTTASWNVTFNNYSSYRNYAHLHRTLRYHFYEDSKGAGRVSSNKKLKVSYIHGTSEDAIQQDKEGMQILENLGQNMAWMLKMREATKESLKEPSPVASKTRTSFIR